MLFGTPHTLTTRRTHTRRQRPNLKPTFSTPQEHTTTVITDMKTRSNTLTRPLVAVLLGSHALGVKATYQYFAGYEPLSNVTHHSMIDIDLKDIIDGLGQNCGEDLNDCSATPACPGNACQYSADDMSFPTAIRSVRSPSWTMQRPMHPIALTHMISGWTARTL